MSVTFGPEFSNYSNVEMKIVNYLIICVAVLPFGMIQLQRLVFPDGAADDTFPIMRKMMNIPSSSPAPATDAGNTNVGSFRSKYNRSMILPVIADIFQASSEDRNRTKLVRKGKSFDFDDLQGEIEIKKCCGRNEVLDKWHRCSGRKNISEIFNKKIQEFMHGNTNLNLKYNDFRCPRKMIQEFVPKEINLDGSIVIEIERSRTNTLDDYYCVDLTEIDDDVVDGLHLIQCDSQG